MGHYAYFAGCPDRESLDRSFAGEGPELELKNDIPLFWLAAFDPQDAFVLRGERERPVAALCAPRALAVERLRRRRAAVLELVGTRFEALYDAWIAHVESAYPHAILLRTWMSEEEEPSLRAAADTVARADRGEPLDREHLASTLDVLHTICDGEEPLEAATRRRAILAGWSVPPREPGAWKWPPRPTEEEIARLDPHAGAVVVSPLPDDIAPAELAARIARGILDAVPAVWASAVPRSALHALLARGELARVYEAARRLPLAGGPAGRMGRATALSWMASLDPEPRSERASRAAEEALCSASSRGELCAAVALVPLVDRAVVRRAKRVAKESSRVALAIRLDLLPAAQRTDGAEPPLNDPYAGEDAPLLQALKSLKGMWQSKKPRRDVVEKTLAEVSEGLGSVRHTDSEAGLHALMAVWLAERGRREEAESALRRGLALEILPEELKPATIAAVRKLGAWGLVDVERCWSGPVLLKAAFVAGRDGDAVRRLLPRIAKEGPRAAALASAVLGAGKVPPAWRAELLACDEAKEDSLHREGGLSADERWAIRFGRAAAGPAPREAMDSLVRAAFAEAHTAAAAFIGVVREALSGGSAAPDPEKAETKIRELVGERRHLLSEITWQRWPSWMAECAPVVSALDPAAASQLRDALGPALDALPAAR